jgi:cytochrome c-type biogenesis protein CcmH
MTLFVFCAVLIIGVAVLIILLPLIRSQSKAILAKSNSNLLILKENLAALEKEFANGLMSEEQFATQKSEIEKRTLDEVILAKETLEPTQHESKWLNYFLIVGVPLAVIGLYFILGNPAALYYKKDPQLVQLEQMVSELELKLKQEPTNAVGWMYLGRTYAAMNRLPEAKIAFKKAITLDPSNDDLLADLADLTSFQTKSINPEALGYVEQALKINPKNPKALALKGTALFDQKNYSGAIQAWELAIRTLGPKDQDFILGLKESIQDAEEQLKSPSPQRGAHVTGSVHIAANLLTKVDPGDTVFIYARATSGPRMPLAIMRFEAKDLPRTFDLNDSQAMSPQMSLSKFDDFTIVARISKSGNAMPQAGDLLGEKEHVKLGTKDLTLIIDHQQP